MTHLLAFDAGWTTNLEAEHSVRTAAQVLGLRAVLACTHFATGPARVVVTVLVEDPVPPDADGTALGLADPGDPAVAGLLDRWQRAPFGRAFVFPGEEALTGVLTVDEVTARSAITRVRGVGTVPPGYAMLDTQDFVRPEYEDGALVLLTRPARGGVLVPFEQRHQVPCCATHG